MLNGGGGLRFTRKTNDKTCFSEHTRAYPLNVLKFRARLDTADGGEAHREFSGAYYPRFRTLYVNEIKDTQKLGMTGIRLVPTLLEDVHLKPNGDYYYTEDFQVGTQLRVRGINVKDSSTDKTWVITDVDKSGLKYATLPAQEKVKPRPRAVEMLVDKIRDAIRSRAGGKLTIKKIGRHFRVVDDDGDRKLGPDEFFKALTEYNIGITAEQANMLLLAFDKNGDGSVSFDEFVAAVRGSMNEERKMAVASAFKKIDYNKDGVLTVDDLAQFYCPKYHPKVITGEVAEADVLRKFLNCFDSKDKDGIVTYAEFCDYYS
eukprot:gene10291-15825_t